MLCWKCFKEEAVKLARIRVEGKMVAPTYVLRDSQRMSHFVHRSVPFLYTIHLYLIHYKSL